MAVLTVSSKGWIVIPAELRRKYGIEPGSRVRIVDYGGVLALVPVAKDPVRQGAGMLKPKHSLTEALLAEHRAELGSDD
ncbi:MAG: AbrB/MazE/SpoVT family DNA-binding domain-containing protein [Anaerolineae bacterium]|nr:AbrB/MazE/SpoVT family DNA-binding domain-containing protein [Anaerolineae bacterium]